jgi:hypothetical protein
VSVQAYLRTLLREDEGGERSGVPTNASVDDGNS